MPDILARMLATLTPLSIATLLVGLATLESKRGLFQKVSTATRWSGAGLMFLTCLVGMMFAISNLVR
jgi:hypothetical protein